MNNMNAMPQAQSLSMPQQRQQAPVDNDRFASQMYQMSTKAKRSKY